MCCVGGCCKFPGYPLMPVTGGFAWKGWAASWQDCWAPQGALPPALQTPVPLASRRYAKVGGNGLARDGEAVEQVCRTCNCQGLTEPAQGKARVCSRRGRETEQGLMLPILIFPLFLPGWLSSLSASKCPGVHGVGHVPEAGRAPHPHPTGSSRWVPCPAPCCGTCSLPGTA